MNFNLIGLWQRLVKLEAIVHRILEASGDIHPCAADDRDHLATAPVPEPPTPILADAGSSG